MSSVIALDYDGTFTADPVGWASFAQMMVERKHSVYIVTMRYPSECRELHPLIAHWQLPVIATERKAKAEFCRKLGIKVDIWIDDHPQAVHLDADSIWKDPAPEGHPVDPANPTARTQ